MTIKCNNIKDFCDIINISFGHELKNIIVFYSSKSSYPFVSTMNTPKDSTDFRFVLLTPIYTAIYNGKSKTELFKDDFDTLETTCQKYNIYMHKFDKMSFNSDSNILSVDTYIGPT